MYFNHFGLNQTLIIQSRITETAIVINVSLLIFFPYQLPIVSKTKFTSIFFYWVDDVKGKSKTFNTPFPIKVSTKCYIEHINLFPIYFKTWILLQDHALPSFCDANSCFYSKLNHNFASENCDSQELPLWKCVSWLKGGCKSKLGANVVFSPRTRGSALVLADGDNTIGNLITRGRKRVLEDLVPVLLYFTILLEVRRIYDWKVKM